MPPSLQDTAMTLNVFRNKQVQLTCPFELGRLQRTLTPYSISWERSDGMSTVPVTSSAQLSPDNTMLTTSITNSLETFRCVLDLQRCDLITNTACSSTMRYLGTFEFQLFGKNVVVCISIAIPQCDMAATFLNPQKSLAC